MRSLDDLAHAIDAASDEGDERSLRQLGDECESRLDTAEGTDRVVLLYYQSNTYYGLVSLKQDGATDVWDWEQSDGVKKSPMPTTGHQRTGFWVDRPSRCLPNPD